MSVTQAMPARSTQQIRWFVQRRLNVGPSLVMLAQP